MLCATLHFLLSTSYCLNAELRKGTPSKGGTVKAGLSTCAKALGWLQWGSAWTLALGHLECSQEAGCWMSRVWASVPRQQPGNLRVSPEKFCWALLGSAGPSVPLKQCPGWAPEESTEAAHVLMNRNSWQHSPREALSHSVRFSGFMSFLTKQGLQRIFVQTFLPPPHWNLKQNVMEIQVLLQLAITKPKF